MELVSITAIKPAKYNPRRIDDAAFAGLCESLKKFGMPQPLVVNSRSDTLVSGHQRLKAAEAIGWVEVPVVYVDLSDAEEKALNVTLNNRHIGGDYTEALGDILAEVREILGADYLADLRLDQLEIGFTAGEAALPDLAEGDKTTLNTMTFTLTEEQQNSVERALSVAKDMGAFVETGNENANGNALARVAELFLGKHDIG